MFDSIKGMAGLAGIMKDLPRIKARMEEAKEALGAHTVEAETGGGAVRVTANGHLKIIKIEIDQPLMAGLVDSTDDADRRMAEDLVTGAVNAALVKARELAQEELAEAMQELGVPVPPGMLDGLLS